MENKINFTAEHEISLKMKAISYLFEGKTFKAAIGTEINIHQLLHDTSLNSLDKLLVSLKKEIETLSSGSKWKLNDYQQKKLEELNDRFELIDLLIGYRMFLNQEEKRTEKVKQLQSNLTILKESKKTPDEKIAELEAEIASLGKTSTNGIS